MEHSIQTNVEPREIKDFSVAIPLIDFWAPVAASLAMIILCLGVSPQREFWNDEVFSWFFLGDPSFSHMLQAFHDKLNNTPLLYFALGWSWSQFFGASELSLRLFSCLGFCVAFFLIWMVLHKNLGFWPSTIGTLSVFMTSTIITYQISEARMYGLFLAVVAGGLYLYDLCGRRKRADWKLILLTFLVQAAILHTHLFGMFYIAVFLLASVTRDAVQKSWQPWIYAAILAGGATFIFYYPAFVVQADAGSPRSWLPLPSPTELKDYLFLQDPSYVSPTVFTLLIIWLLLNHWFFPQITNETKSTADKPLTLNSMQIIGFFLLAVPIGTWVLSYLIRPIHWNRYLIPTTLGMAILVALLIEALLFPYRRSRHKQPQSAPAQRWHNLIIPGLIAVLFLLHPIRKLISIDYTFNRDDYLAVPDSYPNLPIVIQTADFLEVYYNAPPEKKDRFFFIADETAAGMEGSGAFDLQFHKHMLAFKRQYPAYFKNQIIDNEDFLRSHPQFLVIDYAQYDKQCPYQTEHTEDITWWLETHCPQWLEYRILSNPDYQVTTLQTGFEQVPWPDLEKYRSFAILLIERRDSIQ